MSDRVSKEMREMFERTARQMQIDIVFKYKGRVFKKKVVAVAKIILAVFMAVVIIKELNG